MTGTTPQVSNGVLVCRAGAREETLQVGGDAWQRWLAEARRCLSASPGETLVRTHADCPTGLSHLGHHTPWPGS
jgi:hypothetical protein